MWCTYLYTQCPVTKSLSKTKKTSNFYNYKSVSTAFSPEYPGEKAPDGSHLPNFFLHSSFNPSVNPIIRITKSWCCGASYASPSTKYITVQVIRVHNELDISHILDSIVLLHPVSSHVPDRNGSDDLSYYQPGLSYRAIPVASIVTDPQIPTMLYCSPTYTGVRRLTTFEPRVIYTDTSIWYRCYWFKYNEFERKDFPFMSFCDPQSYRQLTPGKSQPDERAHALFFSYLRPGLNDFELLWHSMIMEYGQE
jgi:hypothetical protein